MLWMNFTGQSERHPLEVNYPRPLPMSIHLSSFSEISLCQGWFLRKNYNEHSMKHNLYSVGAQSHFLDPLISHSAITANYETLECTVVMDTFRSQNHSAGNNEKYAMFVWKEQNTYELFPWTLIIQVILLNLLSELGCRHQEQQWGTITSINSILQANVSSQIHNA